MILRVLNSHVESFENVYIFRSIGEKCKEFLKVSDFCKVIEVRTS